MVKTIDLLSEAIGWRAEVSLLFGWELLMGGAQTVDNLGPGGDIAPASPLLPTLPWTALRAPMTLMWSCCSTTTMPAQGVHAMQSW
jgi:hypothetical protein